MKKCNRCQSLFKNCKTIEIPHYEVDTRIYETICVCPECGSDHWDEVTICPACNHNYTKTEYCWACLKDVSDAIGGLAKQKDISFGDAVDLFAAWHERF